ncbi:ATP-binding cassette domain-containing protein [Jatrophihabitans fulvus]
MGDTVLEVRGLTRRFGGVVAIDDLSLDVRRGEVVGVIGPNGAGKSTFVGLVCGALPASAGTVAIDGQDVTRLDAARRARLGVGRTHQIPRPFDRMTVLENLLLAAGSVPKGRSARQREAFCRDVLARTGLADRADERAGGLTLLRRKRLELARALALSPRLLMLDEIGAGLVESETAELIELILQLRDECDALLVIEHVMDVITTCCDRTAVLDFGRLIALGPTREVLADAKVAAVYLGTASVRHRAGDATEPTASDGHRAAEVTEPPPAHHPVAPDAITPLVDTSGPGDGPLLEVRGVSYAYGGLRALRDVDLTVGRGEVVALLGANGAGKTTLTRVVAGALHPDTGTVRFDGRETTAMRADRVTGLGLAQCLEGRRIFGTLSVQENLVLGAGDASAAQRAERLDAVYGVFPALAERRHRSGTAMSGGQQQMLAIGRALMSAPKLVVLDEVSLGLAPIAVDRLYEALAAIAASGVSLVLVEQNIGRGLSLAARAYVLSQGRIALSGTTEDVAAHPALRALYVGETADA